MPKMGRDFPVSLTLAVPQELRIKIIALGYFMGTGGAYASIVRNLLSQAIDGAVSKLDPERRTAFDEILTSVQISERGKHVKYGKKDGGFVIPQEKDAA